MFVVVVDDDDKEEGGRNKKNNDRPVPPIKGACHTGECTTSSLFALLTQQLLAWY